MKSILVTGGTGFIGSHTSLNLLENGYRVIILDSFHNSSHVVIDRIKEILKDKISDVQDKLIIQKGDIRNEDSLKKVFEFAKKYSYEIDAVIHFAGVKAVGESVQNPLLYWDVNVKGSISLLKVMQEYGCKTIVFSSSATIYGEGPLHPLSESAKIMPKNPYGDTKATVELLLENIYLSSKDSWRIASLRYFNPIGAHPSGLLGEDPLDTPNNLFPYICKVATGEYKELEIYGNDWQTQDGTGVRDYIHVMDLAEAHNSALNFLLKEKPKFIKLNIGTGKGTSVLQLLKTFQKVNNCKIPYVFVNRREGDAPFVIAKNDLAISLLNWMPQRSLEEMCIDGWRWQNNNPKGYKSI